MRRISTQRRDRYAWVCRRRIPRRRQFSSASRRRRSPHRRAGLARRLLASGLSTPRRRVLRSSAYRRAGLARHRWRRDLPPPAERSELRTSARGPRQALLASGLSVLAARSEAPHIGSQVCTGSCRRRVSWRWSGWSFPGRRHRTSLRRGAQSVVSRSYDALLGRQT